MSLCELQTLTIFDPWLLNSCGIIIFFSRKLEKSVCAYMNYEILTFGLVENFRIFSGESWRILKVEVTFIIALVAFLCTTCVCVCVFHTSGQCSRWTR